MQLYIPNYNVHSNSPEYRKDPLLAKMSTHWKFHPSKLIPISLINLWICLMKYRQALPTHSSYENGSEFRSAHCQHEDEDAVNAKAGE